MDMYLTDSKGTRLTFPILPDRVSVKMGAMSQTFQIISVGEMKIPRGVSLTGYSFSGIFPGSDMEETVKSFGRTWQKPDTLADEIKKWLNSNETLRFMITETSVNEDVFIEAFNFDYFGTSNISYTLNLSKRASLTITTTPAPAKPTTTTSTDDDSSKTYGIVKVSSTLKVRKKPSSKGQLLNLSVESSNLILRQPAFFQFCLMNMDL